MCIMLISQSTIWFDLQKVECMCHACNYLHADKQRNMHAQVIAPPRAHPFFRVGAPHRDDNHTSMIIFINPSFLLAYIAYLSKFIKPCNKIIALFNGCTFNWHHRSTHSCLCCWGIPRSFRCLPLSLCLLILLSSLYMAIGILDS